MPQASGVQSGSTPTRGWRAVEALCGWRGGRRRHPARFDAVEGSPAGIPDLAQKPSKGQIYNTC